MPSRSEAERREDFLLALCKRKDLRKSARAADIYGRVWDLPESELCSTCGQPDNCGDCNHERLTDDEVAELQGT
jgi:hypothetical protein